MHEKLNWGKVIWIHFLGGEIRVSSGSDGISTREKL